MGQNTGLTLVRYNETVIHRRVLFNDQVHDSSEKLLVAGQVGLLAGWGRFSTIRGARGVPFAFERPLARMVEEGAFFPVPHPCAADRGRRRVLRLAGAQPA